MDMSHGLGRKAQVHQRVGVQLVSFLIGAHGLYILTLTLLGQFAAHSHHGSRLSDVVVDVPLLIGLSLLYLSTLIRRRKRTAWIVAIAAYVIYLALGVSGLLDNLADHSVYGQEVIKGVLLPLVIVGLLLALRRAFVVKSDIQGFRLATRFAAIVLVATLLYGTAGILLMDKSDFHQEVGSLTAIHYT
ncbi:MAG: hypothetical protein ACREJM_06010, partial [Candidatus Saccharimonadales bacterium]